MEWIWSNPTKVIIEKGCINEYLKNFIQPNSKIIFTCDDESTMNPKLKDEIQFTIDGLLCNSIWEYGVSDKSNYDRLIEIINTVAQKKPDLIIAIGGKSVLNGTKFIACASHLPEGVDVWSELLLKEQYPDEVTPFGCIITVPACGNEWNSDFTISRHFRSKAMTLAGGTEETHPIFTLIDPLYLEPISKFTFRNIVFESFVNIIDQVISPLSSPLMDNFFISAMKELVRISMIYFKQDEKKNEEEDDEAEKIEKIQKENDELFHRLIVASLFSNNLIFSLGKEKCWEIHTIAYQVSANYEIELAQSLALICPFFLENQFAYRIPIMAKAAVNVFDVDDTIEGEEEKARAFINELRNFIDFLHLPKKVTDLNDYITDEENKIVVEENDLEVVADLVMNSVMKSVKSDSFGFRNQITKKDVKLILKKIIL